MEEFGGSFFLNPVWGGGGVGGGWWGRGGCMGGGGRGVCCFFLGGVVDFGSLVWRLGGWVGFPWEGLLNLLPGSRRNFSKFTRDSGGLNA